MGAGQKLLGLAAIGSATAGIGALVYSGKKLEEAKREHSLCSLELDQARDARQQALARAGAATRDALTNAKTRHNLRDDFPTFHGHSLFVMICDLDDFKFYNDRHGHDVGDGLLRSFFMALRDAFGDDSVYRYGGDEFLVVSADFGEDEFRSRAQRCSDGLKDVTIQGENAHLTFSGGYTWGDVSKDEDFRKMLRIADMKLLDAKRSGKNRVIGADPAALDPEKMKQRQVGNLPSSEVDGISGLATMRFFQGTFARTLRMRQPDMPPLSIAFIDVSNFKDYNHRFGFEQGNVFLGFLGQTIRSAYPDAIASARVAADKFVVLTSTEDMDANLERLHEAVRGFRPEKAMEVNIGIYDVQPGEVDNVAIVDFAKMACDSCKRHYGVFMRRYDDDLRSYVEQRQYVLDNLDKALQDGWISVAYQPIVDIQQNRVCEFEALARWTDPEKGPLSPGVFIPALEDFSFIYRLDLHMIRKVCEDFARLNKRGLPTLPVSVNLSRLDFELCDIVTEVIKIVDEIGIAHDALHLEVTESAFVLNHDLIRAQVNELRENGFQVWMDDFGSGYSSLNVLSDCEFDLLKIDMEFVHNLDGDTKSRRILPYIVGMSKKLGISTLSEGVETPEQLDYLREIGCEKVQGFLYSRPMPLCDCVKFMQDKNLYPNEI